MEEPVSIGNPGMQFNLYPNPANDNVVIDYVITTGEGRLEVHDLLGRPIVEMELSSKSGKVQLPDNDTPVGYYLLELKGDKGKMTRRLAVVR